MEETKKTPKPQPTGPAVYVAISNVTARLAREGVSKGQTNKDQNYKYRGIDDVYNALAPAFAENRLMMLPRVLSREVTERKTKHGTPLFSVVVDVEYDIKCGDDGSQHTIRVVGEAMDMADKATNKAMSAAFKYACMQVFCIPTEGDNDADASTPQLAAEEAPKRTSAALKRDGAWQEMQAKLRDCAKPSEAMEVFHETNLSGWPAAWIDALANEMAKVFIDDMQDCPTDELDAWGRHWADEIKALPEEARLTIREEIKRRRAAVS